MRLLLIRHGHVEGIDPPRFRGKVDLPLTELGARQDRATARRIASEWSVDRILSRPLGRSAGKSPHSLPVRVRRAARFYICAPFCLTATDNRSPQTRGGRSKMLREEHALIRRSTPQEGGKRHLPNVCLTTDTVDVAGQAVLFGRSQRNGRSGRQFSCHHPSAAGPSSGVASARMKARNNATLRNAAASGRCTR